MPSWPRQPSEGVQCCSRWLNRAGCRAGQRRLHRWLLAVLGISVAATAYWRRALTLDGALGAAVVGGVVFARGGGPAAGALLVFFSTSSVLSRVGPTRKHTAAMAQAKGARRD